MQPSQHVCHMRRPIYGLKQAVLTYFVQFWQSLLSAGYIESYDDYAFFRHSTSSWYCSSLTLIEDIITGSDMDAITAMTSSI